MNALRIFFLLAMIVRVDADENEAFEVFKLKTSEGVQKEAQGREVLIREEIKKLKGHSWAGIYYEGDGLGTNVRVVLAPTNGFVFSWHGCLGIYDRNYGSVAESNGVIRLSFELPNKWRGFQGLEARFVPVRWGERVYLVRPEKMAEFGNKVNSQFEPRREMWGRPLLREGDEKKSVSGQPEVPAEFKAFLLKKPVVAE
jgi:hypothetical protein